MEIIFFKLFKTISDSSLFIKVIHILCVLCSGNIKLKHFIQISPCSSSENFPFQKIHSASLFSDSLVEYVKSVSDNTFVRKIVLALSIALAIFSSLTVNFYHVMFVMHSISREYSTSNRYGPGRARAVQNSQLTR